MKGAFILTEWVTPKVEEISAFGNVATEGSPTVDIEVGKIEGIALFRSKLVYVSRKRQNSFRTAHSRKANFARTDAIGHTDSAHSGDISQMTGIPHMGIGDRTTKNGTKTHFKHHH